MEASLRAMPILSTNSMVVPDADEPRQDPACVEPPGTFASELLERVVAGDTRALSDLVSTVQHELVAIARRERRRWSPPPSLLTAEIVSETYLRLMGAQLPPIQDREHFFAVAARTMRWILVNRLRRAERRPSGTRFDGLEAAQPDDGGLDLLALDEALEKLAAYDPELARLVELRFFLGLQMMDISQVMGIPERSLFRAWERARRWLHRELRADESEEHR